MIFKENIELEKYYIVGEVMYTKFAGVDSSIIEIEDNNGDKATLVYKGNLTSETLELGEIIVKSGKMTNVKKDKIVITVDSVYETNMEMIDAIDLSNESGYDFEQHLKGMDNTKSKMEILTLLYAKKLRDFIEKINELSLRIGSNYDKEIKVLETAFLEFTKKKITSEELEASIEDSMMSSYLDENGEEPMYLSYEKGHLNYDLNESPYAQKIMEKGSLHIISGYLTICEKELKTNKTNKTSKVSKSSRKQ